MENALVHIPAGKVQVEIAAGDVLSVRVIDEGPGFPAHVLGAAGAAASGEEGARFGLAITRAVARAHGGHLQLTNRPGGGAEARIALPLVARPA